MKPFIILVPNNDLQRLSQKLLATTFPNELDEAT